MNQDDDNEYEDINLGKISSSMLLVENMLLEEIFLMNQELLLGLPCGKMVKTTIIVIRMV